MDSLTKQTIQEHFPGLHEPELLEALLTQGQLVSVEAGEVLVAMGSYIKVMPLLLSGSVKVMREDDAGHELFLYYINAGETCAMSLTCCMADKPSEISAIAEEPSVFLAVPVKQMDQWMERYSSWRQFLLQTYSIRFEELLSSIDKIAFLKMDERLMNYLKEKAEATHDKTLQVTHQQIAYDLNSSREVISRLLKQLERLGKIELGRNKITLLAS